MSISQYIKEIGRGQHGARALSRAQAADLFAQVLDGNVTDLEIGAFCLAMRIKGETPQELAGFLDATYPRLQRLPPAERPMVVLPSYNGARKLPVLTPLLALLLARAGLPVLIHGTATESARVFTSNVLAAIGVRTLVATEKIANGEVVFAPTELLSPSLKRLLDVRRVVGLRNPAHSVVKLLNPCEGKSVLVTSYTHPSYAESMAATLTLMQSNALLLRGTEGEAVANARRMPQMDAFVAGCQSVVQEAQVREDSSWFDEAPPIDAASTAASIAAMLAGEQSIPAPIAQQVAHVLQVVARVEAL